MYLYLFNLLIRCRMWDKALQVQSYCGWKGLEWGRMALAGQPPHEDTRSCVRGVCYQYPLACHCCSLRAGQWKFQVSFHLVWPSPILLHWSWMIVCSFARYSQPDQWEVYLGLLNQGETTKSTKRSVKRIISHPKYDDQSYDNDIALMELDSPVTLGRNIWPVCLPEATHDFPAGKSVWITGWGKLREELSKSCNNL